MGAAHNQDVLVMKLVSKFRLSLHLLHHFPFQFRRWNIHCKSKNVTTIQQTTPKLKRRRKGVTFLVVVSNGIERVGVASLEDFAAATSIDFDAICDVRWMVNAQAICAHRMRLHQVLYIVHSVFNALHALVCAHAGGRDGQKLKNMKRNPVDKYT
jgi:hypothetical protein